jgi:hypothetical protein
MAGGSSLMTFEGGNQVFAIHDVQYDALRAPAARRSNDPCSQASRRQALAPARHPYFPTSLSKTGLLPGIADTSSRCPNFGDNRPNFTVTGHPLLCDSES